jgi:hypothetical protein
VIEAMTAWCSAYGVDRNFWAEKNIGSRVCAWLDILLAKDAGAHDLTEDVADELFKCLDIFIRSGVAQARVVEEKITHLEGSRRQST